MYYSAGNYEAYARPEKPEGADRKSAYIIGTGLAGLSAAFYLVRDGQLKGDRIHVLEKLDLARRERSEADRRVIYVTATDKYKELRRKAETNVSGYFSSLMDSMEPGDRELVFSALEKLDEALVKRGQEGGE